jgi:hypothetical protein
MQSRASTSAATETYHSHALAHHKHKCLLIDGAWVRKEEVGERKVKEGYGSNDGLGGYESHDYGSASTQVEVEDRWLLSRCRLCRE